MLNFCLLLIEDVLSQLLLTMRLAIINDNRQLSTKYASSFEVLIHSNGCGLLHAQMCVQLVNGKCL